MVTRNIVFRKGICRFGYQPISDTLLIPKTENNIDKTNFDWIINSLSHEGLHEILFKFIGINESRMIDNFSYNNICNGCCINQRETIWKKGKHKKFLPIIL